jgi:molybdopterin molybdotransferase
VLARACRLPAEVVPLGEALGRVLAADVVSDEDVPAFDNSAMDGFALRSADTAGASAASAVELAVVAESRAGSPTEVELGGGEAARISTGAVLPRGADAILRKEDGEDRGDVVALRTVVAPGKEVRRTGEDIRSGETVLESGSALGPAEVGVLASVGAAEALCARRPRVAVVTTGDELVGPEAPLAPGQVRNSNSYAVPALARLAGAEVTAVLGAADDLAATVEALRRGLRADVLVICGGVSVGAHDHVKPALAELGVEQGFWGVALRPGHPTWFGVKEWGDDDADRGDREQTLVFGLPGNPVSAMVTFHLFVRPALAALAGAEPRPRLAPATIDSDYAKQPGRAHVVRCRLEARADGLHVRPTKAQGSHVLTSMLGAEALAFIEVERADVKAGEQVEIEIL